MPDPIVVTNPVVVRYLIFQLYGEAALVLTLVILACALFLEPILLEDDNQAAKDDAPSKAASTTSISIYRSKYKSDVEASNDNSRADNSSSPTLYTGTAEYGVVHANSSAPLRGSISSLKPLSVLKPTIHLWLEAIEKWPATIEALRGHGYDNFHFTPYSSKKNWAKTYPELKIEFIARKKKREASESGESNKSANGKINMTMFLTAGAICLFTILIHDIGYLLFGIFCLFCALLRWKGYA